MTPVEEANTRIIRKRSEDKKEKDRRKRRNNRMARRVIDERIGGRKVSGKELRRRII